MGTIPERYVVITGATSGIGLALVNRLASEFNQNHRLHLCLLCRNMSKGSLVKQDIESHHKTVVVDLVKMDVSSVQSVRAASQKIINMYSRIDCMYLNAGIMPVAKFNIPYVMKTMFTSEGLQMFKTGLGMFSANDGTTVDGVKNIFATNVLGHFILVDEVIPVLTSQNDQHCAQIIWTGSTNASKKSFKLNDVTCKNGSQPYSSSKYVLEAVSIEMNERLNPIGIFSHVADPGTAKTNITKGSVASWIWCFVIPFMYLLRFFLPNLTITPYNACHSMVWLFCQDPQTLDDRCRYCSYSNIYNQCFIHKETLAPSRFESKLIYDQVKKVANNICQ